MVIVIDEYAEFADRSTTKFNGPSREARCPCTDRTVRVWDLDTGQSHTLTGHTDWVLSVAYSRTAVTSPSGGSDRTVRVWPSVTATLALPGALELIDVLNARGVVASCGHSDATAEQAARAFDRGAATVTHLFNAMRPLGHRDPGIAGAALARDDVSSR